MAAGFDEAVRELDAFAKAKAAGWTAQGGWPGPSPIAERQVLRASRAFGLKPAPKQAPRPAPHPESREEKLARLHARVRTAIPDVMAKAMRDFAAGRIDAVAVSKIEGQLNLIRAIVS